MSEANSTSLRLSATGVFVLAGVKHLEGIAGLHFALEIDVVGVDADQIFDDRPRNLVAQRGLVDALIESHAGRVVFVGVVLGIVGDFGVDILDVDRHVFSGVRQRHHGVDPAIAGDDDADRLQPLAAGTGAISTRSFWPSLMPPSRPRGPSTRRWR